MNDITGLDGFNVQGFGLAMLALILIIAMIVCQRWIKKVTNCYFFWAAIAIFSLVWFIVFKWAPDIKTYHAAKDLNMNVRSDCYILSSAFLMDCCPFSTFALSLLLIVDPTRKAARSFAPIGILGGIIVIFIQMPFDESARFTLKFIFMGDNVNPIYYFFHAFNLLAGIGVMLNTPRFGWKGWVLCFIMFLAYYGYVGIMMSRTGCKYHVSGLSVEEWTDAGEYIAVHHVLHCSPATARIVGLIGLPCAASGLIALNDFVFKRWWWKYGNAYSNKWYLWYDVNRYSVQRIL